MRSKWVDIDGPVHYMDWGGEGRPMGLVHGLGGSYIEWMLMAPHLAGLLAARFMGPRGLVESALRRAVVDFEALDSRLVDSLVAMEEARIRAGLPYVGWTEARMSMNQYYRDVRAFDRDVVDPITT